MRIKMKRRRRREIGIFGQHVAIYLKLAPRIA
jgi:hypothetical protein